MIKEMENSLDSSTTEPTVTGVKSIFKTPASNVIQAFEVSLSESTSEGIQSNKSDADLERNAMANRIVPFKKPRKINQESFNISSEESVVNSELEQSVTFVKPKSLFKAKKQPLKDPFQVSFSETITSAKQDDSESVYSEDEDESTMFFSKSNPFKKKKKSDNETTEKGGHGIEISIAHRNDLESSALTEGSTLQESQENVTFANSSVSGVDTTTFATKTNPFKRPNKSKNESSLLKMSFKEENVSTRTSLRNRAIDGLEKSRNSDTSKYEELNTPTSVSKQNPFSRKESSAGEENTMQVSAAEESELEHSTRNNVRNNEPKQSLGNLSFDKSRSNFTNKGNNSDLYLDQSSINDENLNHWMSDHSDEEVPPCTIPSITSKFSLTKEKQTQPETPGLTLWEEKFQEIVSKSKKTIQMKKVGEKTLQDSETKKPEPKIEKPLQQSNKYKPPKLNKPATFATKRLYQYIISKLKPKYGIDAIIEAEQLISSICDTVKKVTRRKTHQKKLIQDLKKEMATAGVIETTVDFYEFVIKFLPYSFRVKIVPCIQPVTNTVHPPKDTVNPFEKIL